MNVHANGDANGDGIVDVNGDGDVALNGFCRARLVPGHVHVAVAGHVTVGGRVDEPR